MPLRPNQFDALVSFLPNPGHGRGPGRGTNQIRREADLLLTGNHGTKAAPAGLELDRPPGTLPDLAGTASLIARLDLVVTVDTAVAHLAGALGRPVWLLNRYGGDWRWQDGNLGPDGVSLWYPTLRQFRQAEPLPPEQA